MQTNTNENLFSDNQKAIPETNNFSQYNLNTEDDEQLHIDLNKEQSILNNHVDFNNIQPDDFTEQTDRLNNISLCLTIEVGQVHLSLKQLLELKLNDTLDFAGLPPKVKLVLNHVIIGEGYLVEFNGRLGVKISNLNTNIKLNKSN